MDKQGGLTGAILSQHTVESAKENGSCAKCPNPFLRYVACPVLRMINGGVPALSPMFWSRIRCPKDGCPPQAARKLVTPMNTKEGE